jgi:hypothetical protein
MILIALSAAALAAGGPQGPVGPPDRSTPAAAAAAFYDAYLATTAGAFPGPQARTRLRRLLSPRLNALLGQADRAEAMHAWRTHRREPPMIQGDIFTSSYGGAGRFRVMGCRSYGDQATCMVVLDGGGRPSRWRDLVVMMRAPTGWVVDDVVYGLRGSSGSSRRLSQALQTVIGAG